MAHDHPDREQPPMESASIPLWREELQVGTRVVETGGVRLHKTVTTEQRLIDPPLMQETLTVERVPVGRWVERGKEPQARQEGDTYVVPVLEEVLVTEKKLRLKEEVRITRQRREIHTPQQVEVRAEQVRVERFENDREADSGR